MGKSRKRELGSKWNVLGPWNGSYRRRRCMADGERWIHRFIYIIYQVFQKNASAKGCTVVFLPKGKIGSFKRLLAPRRNIWGVGKMADLDRFLGQGQEQGIVEKNKSLEWALPHFLYLSSDSVPFFGCWFQRLPPHPALMSKMPPDALLQCIMGIA